MISFSIWDYMIPAAAIPAGLIILLPLAAGITLRWTKKYTLFVRLLPLILAVIADGFLLTAAAQAGEQIGNFRNNYSLLPTSGFIEKIETVAPFPLYFDKDSNALVRGKLVTISGKQFITISLHGFSEGDLVTVCYPEGGRMVLKLHEGEAEASDFVPAVPEEEKTAKGVNPVSVYVFVLFCVIVGCFFLRSRLSEGLSKWLKRTDSTHGRVVCARKETLRLTVAAAIVAFGLGLVQCFLWDSTFSVIQFCIGAFLLYTRYEIPQTRLEYGGNEVRFFFHDRMEVLSVKQITEARWVKSRPGWAFVIVVGGRKVELLELEYVGLHSFCSWLRRKSVRPEAERKGVPPA